MMVKELILKAIEVDACFQDLGISMYNTASIRKSMFDLGLRLSSTMCDWGLHIKMILIGTSKSLV